ncbi:hypothetical protein LUW75_17125 [Streptomyces sp. MRC013]|uniref:hypothetical protein n=1 Tax=Streptomyces sp. MRC013 TaxID=2898276 RepID=UPI002026950F|nr:hypothetical protein [Streptomyces sp. MRC013]URM91407.1 hypothetical protein LUW75_17125 [Streptomyces sp. MRC013]
MSVASRVYVSACRRAAARCSGVRSRAALPAATIDAANSSTSRLSALNHSGYPSSTSCAAMPGWCTETIGCPKAMYSKILPEVTYLPPPARKTRTSAS